ncbi:3-deoxy-D-manno-octulosonic acid transferase [Vicingus serpentipes]|uniref:3-deoxy-D-manno-octulosonic acid transferase n=1 Tax=Vicingus serpentipes TaxID=1926625 RepID=A0A5C6RX22_9FLAO|nr:glycosyltransferase N-terminal domain-containing protein [Vicingus serpentipes]TXB66851.1 3-deoxy-D-manno-octulosonic acid transferase [Vicingus serpentipes]
MKLIYQISVLSYSSLIHIASFFNPKAKQWVEGRKNIFNLIASTIKPSDKIAWFHCASLGEFEQGKPVIEGFKKKYPDHKILITFFSPSGYELRKNYGNADYVFYLPIDTKKNAKKFIKTIQPNVAFFVKYEFWNFYLEELFNKKIPTYLISGVFRKNQLFFKWYGAWYKKMLAYFNHFFLQNKASENLLKEIGYSNATISGDTRFDRVYENSLSPEELPIIKAFKSDQKIIIGGSSWPEEENILAKYYQSNQSNFKLIIAPHNISENHIQQIEKLFNNNCIRHSEATLKNIGTQNVLIIDNIGILSNIYQYTDIALIGGGFTGALHNILEPTSFGNTIFFGPKHQKFHEAQNLINAGGAITISTEFDFAKSINEIIPKLDIIKKQNIAFIANNKGATNIILSKV